MGIRRLLRVAALLCFLPFCALAQDNQSGQQTGGDAADLIELLKEKGVITEQEARTLQNREAGREQPPADDQRIFPNVSKEKEQQTLEQISEEAAGQIQENVRDIVKEELKEEIQREARAEGWYEQLPDWTKRIRLGGDIRLRYQGDYYDENNALLLDPSDPDELLNTTEDTDRFRYRLRFGLNADIGDHFLVGLRLTTGSLDNPVSTNETLGDFFNRDSIVLDRAYLQWNPILEYTMWGGRFPNPWFCTDLVWDADVNFEGIAANYNREAGRKFRPFVTVGAFPIQFVEFGDDKWLLAAQAGTEYRPRADLITKFGVAYYDYENMVGRVNDPLRPGQLDYTAPEFQQKGNTLMDIDPSDDILTAYASDFDLLNLTFTFDMALFYPIHLIFVGDYVINLGFDQKAVSDRAGEQVPKENKGYQLGLSAGHPSVSNLWQWNVGLFYKYLEADAVPDAFTDSDFHGGGTNAKGWILQSDLGVYKNIWFRLKYLSTDEISGPPVVIDTLQLDLNAKF